MKRRAEIARGLVHFPKVLFLDEPTTGLDPQTRVNVWDYILKLQKQKNITIFLTTHYMEEAEICDKVAIIDKGKIVAHDTPYNLKKQHSSTRMNLQSSDMTLLKSYLDNLNIKYLENNSHISAFVNDTEKIMDIITQQRSIITDLEISKGSLNDVFLAITGKEIRE
jgi:ABC-2 type transport system ATP-binding protein